MLLIGILSTILSAGAMLAQPSDRTIEAKHRAHLPMSNTIRATSVVYDAKDPEAKFPPIETLRPPEGAPNVVIFLIDDAGVGASAAFGGPCQTPTLDKLASNGLKYNRFHTTALCSPTRQALLTGRNHHSAGMGNMANSNLKCNERVNRESAPS